MELQIDLKNMKISEKYEENLKQNTEINNENNTFCLSIFIILVVCLFVIKIKKG